MRSSDRSDTPTKTEQAKQGHLLNVIREVYGGRVPDNTKMRRQLAYRLFKTRDHEQIARMFKALIADGKVTLETQGEQKFIVLPDYQQNDESAKSKQQTRVAPRPIKTDPVAKLFRGERVQSRTIGGALADVPDDELVTISGQPLRIRTARPRAIQPAVDVAVKQPQDERFDGVEEIMRQRRGLIAFC
jgi:hypothetical protein